MAQPYHHGALPAALLAKAEAILERDGIQALSLRATAREAGVSHAAPTHHFGDLGGLLTALVASGFIRLRTHMDAAVAAAGPDPAQRLVALGRAYVGFARASPGLFKLMFRTERFDKTSVALVEAAQGAFALLTQDGVPPDATRAERLTIAVSRLSLMHGLSTLIVDGRVAPLVDQTPGAEMDGLIEDVLAGLSV